MTDEFKPLPGERGVRFGCGAIAGVVCGFFIAIRETGGNLPASLAFAALAALAFGALATRYGDSAWHWLSRVLMWLRY